MALSATIYGPRKVIKSHNFKGLQTTIMQQTLRTGLRMWRQTKYSIAVALLCCTVVDVVDQRNFSKTSVRPSVRPQNVRHLRNVLPFAILVSPSFFWRLYAHHPSPHLKNPHKKGSASRKVFIFITQKLQFRLSMCAAQTCVCVCVYLCLCVNSRLNGQKHFWRLVVWQVQWVFRNPGLRKEYGTLYKYKHLPCRAIWARIEKNLKQTSRLNFL